MNSIIEIIVYIIMGSLTIFIAYKDYKMIKETDDPLEKTIYIFTACGFGFLFGIYFLDRYNIPSYFNWTENINTGEWLNLLGTLFSTVVGSLISAVVLILVTKSQIEKTYKDNVSLNDEGYRIQNLPYLQYGFNDQIEDPTDLNKTKIIMIKHSDGDSVAFSLTVKNIGLNAIRKTCIVLESALFSKIETTELFGDSSIDKGELRKKDFFITNLCAGNYLINIIVYYQDIMKNWYEQRIKLHLDVTDKYVNNQRICYKNFEVLDETRIDDDPRHR